MNLDFSNARFGHFETHLAALQFLLGQRNLYDTPAQFLVCNLQALQCPLHIRKIFLLARIGRQHLTDSVGTEQRVAFNEVTVDIELERGGRGGRFHRDN